MESDSTSFFSSQQDDNPPIICPEFSIWDVGIYHNLFPDNDSPRTEAAVTENEKVKQPEKSSKENVELSATANQEMQKKMARREIEKRRRREMATLCASLRSVVPPRFVKGKSRSIIDEIHAATNYIASLQTNIKQLKIKREHIKSHRKNELLVSEKGSSSKNSPPIIVKVESSSVGIQVLISTHGHFMAKGLTLIPLSKIVQLLLEHGLNVVDCNCTKSDGRAHYSIQSEVHTFGVDLRMLQMKLITMINALADIKQ